MVSLPLYIFEKYDLSYLYAIFSLIFLLCTGIFRCGESINTYLHTYHLTADVCLALIWQVTDDLQNCKLQCILRFQQITFVFCDISGFLSIKDDDTFG